MRMLPLKLLFLLNWNRGGDREYFMIITGPFIKSTFAQFSPFLTPLPVDRFPKNIIEDVRFWPELVSGEWGEINFEQFRVGVW